MALPDDASPSTAAIAGHPLHPMLVPFPIAFLVATLVVDIAFSATHDPFWGRAAFWLLAAGIVMAAAAAIVGLIDFLTIRRVRSLSIAWVHFLGNGLAVLLAIWNIALRWSDPARWIVPPLGYAAWTFIHGAFSGFYPYPFVNVTKLGAGRVALNSAGMTLLFLIVGLLLVAIDRALARVSGQSVSPSRA